MEHPNSTEGRLRERERDRAREREWTSAISEAEAAGQDTSIENDLRSPLKRFREPPNKAFSVSDLISPSWCEQQYWYTLTKHGRKKSTPSMKSGKAVHKILEDEVSTTVPVKITTKEDAWALRIWNVIQGLRMLRERGITREFEVWGLVDGELVNGIIDQLSYECPDPHLEAEAAAHYASIEAERATVPEYQMSLSEYLLSPAQGGKKLSDLGTADTSRRRNRRRSSSESDIPRPQLPPHLQVFPRIYLQDVKTRGSRSVPTLKSSSFLPTQLQLDLYYHMLSRLVTTDEVSIELLASRYSFDPQRPFTDAFISEVGGLNDQFFETTSNLRYDDPDYVPTPDDAHKTTPSFFHNPSPSLSEDSTSLLLEYNNLSELWQFMKQQLRLTFLPPASSGETNVSGNDSTNVAPSIPAESQPRTLESYMTILSPLLSAKFVSATPTTDETGTGVRVLGTRSFLFDPATMTSYIRSQMEWWRGFRRPRGVDITDAWKCRICEFKDICEWRLEREWAPNRRGRSEEPSSQ